MKTLGNILWLLLFGWWMALAYVVAGLLMILPIITIPFSFQSFKLAGFVLWPFGQVVVDAPRRSVAVSTVANVIWILLAGWWLALGHLLAALIFFVTIVGIPFAWANVKLAGLALVPFGRTIVSARRVTGHEVVRVAPLGER